MSRRPYYLAFSMVFIITLIALNLPERHALRVKLVWGSVFVPLFGLAGSLSSLADDAGYRLVPRSVLLRRLEGLQRENEELRLQLRQLEAARAENTRLRQAVQWQPQAPWRLRAARVITQEPTSWWRSIQIDLGEREGLKVDQPVLTPSGLVGRVTEVAFTRARVLLVGDPNSQLSAQVEDTRDKGVLAPDENSYDHQVVNFIYVPRGVLLNPGAAVVTSGDGGVFPKGIPIGRIVDVRTNTYDLYLEARVRLSANLNRLEEVWVVFP